MTYYDLLGVRPGVGPEELRRGYLRAARRTHPDGGGSATEFHAVRTAWATLSDPGRRAAYDLEHYLDPAPDVHHDEEWTGFGSGATGRSLRLSVLGPILLGGALTASVVALVWPPLLLLAAAYVVATMAAVARRVHPHVLVWRWWPGERSYRVLLRGAWILAGCSVVAGGVAVTLGRSPTTPLLWSACAATFAVATLAAGELTLSDED